MKEMVLILCQRDIEDLIDDLFFETSRRINPPPPQKKKQKKRLEFDKRPGVHSKHYGTIELLMLMCLRS